MPTLVVAAILIFAGGLFIQNEHVTTTDERSLLSWVAESTRSGTVVFKIVSSVDGQFMQEWRINRRTGAMNIKRGERIDLDVSMIIPRSNDDDHTVRCTIRSQGQVIARDVAVVKSNSSRDGVLCSVTVTGR